MAKQPNRLLIKLIQAEQAEEMPNLEQDLICNSSPEYQTRVPMQLWFPTSSANDMQVDLRCMANLAQNADLSHDHLFHTLMGMFQVRSYEYDQSHDLLAMCPLPAEQAQLQVIPHPEEHPNLEP